MLHTLLPADRPGRDRSLGNALASAIQASSSLRIIALPVDLLVGAALDCDAVGALLGISEDEGDKDDEDDGALLGASDDEGDKDDEGDGALLGVVAAGDNEDDGAVLPPPIGRAVGISDTYDEGCELVYDYN